MDIESIVDYGYRGSDLSHTHEYLWPRVLALLQKHPRASRRVFEIGCGNGAVANLLSEAGYEVTAIDASDSGIAVARKSYPHIHFDRGSVYDDLAARFGQFPVVISLEVIEHCAYGHAFAKTFYSLLETGGVGLISTPYHGYIKNLALAVTGRMEKHLSPLWDGGHVKFWSIPSLRGLLHETGFTDMIFYRVGRIPVLAKSMVVVVRK